MHQAGANLELSGPPKAVPAGHVFLLSRQVQPLRRAPGAEPETARGQPLNVFSCSHYSNGAVPCSVGSRNIGLRFATGEALESFLALMWRQLWRGDGRAFGMFEQGEDLTCLVLRRFKRGPAPSRS